MSPSHLRRDGELTRRDVIALRTEQPRGSAVGWLLLVVRFDSERDASREFRNREEAAVSRPEHRLRAPALRLEAEAGSCAPSAPEDRLRNPPAAGSVLAVW
jgi:hypothetical protein